MTFLEFISSFFIFTTFASLVINGWYKLTRHSEVVQPDGKITIEGHIFKWWSVFWEEVKGEKKVFYSGKQLSNKVVEIKQSLPNLDILIQKQDGDDFMTLDNASQLELIEIENAGNVFVLKKEEKLFLFIKDPIYRITEFIRLPLSGCIDCMSSFYGTVIYLFFIYLQKDLFVWSSHQFIAKFVFWIFLLLTLVVTNKFIHSKTDV